MQFRKLFVLVLFLILPPLSRSLKAQSYAFEELTTENLTAVSPFSVTQVVPIDGGLRIFIGTDNPDAVAGLLATGALITQLSDHVAGTEAPVPISFGKAVWCTTDGDPVYLAYQDPLPSCGGQPPAIIEYYFDAAAVLGPGRDLALGLEPNFLWLIAEQ
jgi:hypothetical protein